MGRVGLVKYLHINCADYSSVCRYFNSVCILTLSCPLLPYGYSNEASCVADRVKPSFVIFDIRALWRWALSVRVPGCQNYKTRFATQDAL